VSRNEIAVNELLSSILRDVSRSFYLTLRVLPGSIRPQIGLAYLLARTTDTITDTELVPVEKRLETLDILRDRIAGSAHPKLAFDELLPHQSSTAERRLLEHCEQALALLQTFTPADIQLIRDVLKTITSGQQMDLKRFGRATSERIVALETEEELDDYTWRVAGCVGEFWSTICRAHVFPKARLDTSVFLATGVRFGKGLQRVNILRDLQADVRYGRCYLPARSLANHGLSTEDLLDPTSEPRLRPLYQAQLSKAEADLAAGWVYTNMVPRGAVRVRLACVWPLLIGRRTIEMLRTANVLEPGARVKVSREEVKRIIWRSIAALAWPAAWRKLFPLTIRS
jgi:farnesyl-diphosphate farnesyltransferase